MIRIKRRLQESEDVIYSRGGRDVVVIKTPMSAYDVWEYVFLSVQQD